MTGTLSSAFIMFCVRFWFSEHASRRDLACSELHSRQQATAYMNSKEAVKGSWGFELTRHADAGPEAQDCIALLTGSA